MLGQVERSAASEVLDSGRNTSDWARDFDAPFAEKRAATGGGIAHGAMKTNTRKDALCACGSGLRSCRCCELDSAFAASPEAMQRADVVANCAANTFASGNTVLAEAQSLDALDMAPGFPAALWILYQIRRRA